MSGSKSNALSPALKLRLLEISRKYDRSAEPCADCGEPSGRTFYPAGKPVRCSECFSGRLFAKKAAARDEKLKEAP